ncbi:MAG: DoxX family protein [Paludibacteraceae bacterium]|nr:DoxX family protein [Paludibacteraceae bacterium]
MKHTFATFLGHCSRILLGLVFLFSGFVKAVDPLGTVYKIEDYLKAFGGFFTDLLPLATAAAFVLIAAEFVLGVCLFLNVRTQWTAWLSLLFYLIMTPLTLYIALANPVSDCGCFGDAIVLTNWQTFWKNVVLLLLVIVLLCTKRYIRPRWRWYAECGIAVISLAAVIGWMVWTLYHLPVIDFRPYKVGNNLVELMEYPEDAPRDEYKVTLVYSREGVEKEFSLSDYPKGDSTWTFVRQESQLVKKGYEPPIHDLEIMNRDYEDITYDILESEAPVVLVIMYDLDKADKVCDAELSSLQAMCEERGTSFYILTGSGSDRIDAFVSKEGMYSLETAVCSCDPVTLKTIVRANPGVMVIQNGIVKAKYNLRATPAQEVVESLNL